MRSVFCPPTSPELSVYACPGVSKCGTYVQFVACFVSQCLQPFLLSYPSYSIVLMMNPSVGLTLFTSSFIIFFTMVVFPALSNPLCSQRCCSKQFQKHTQHQYSHFLVLQARFSQYRQHFKLATVRCCSVTTDSSVVKSLSHLG